MDSEMRAELDAMQEARLPVPLGPSDLDSPVTKAAALAIAGYEPLDALLHFARIRNGAVEIKFIPSIGVHVTVKWHSIGQGNQRVFAEDRTVEEAAMMCRGLLAHALAAGVASP